MLAALLCYGVRGNTRRCFSWFTHTHTHTHDSALMAPWSCNYWCVFCWEAAIRNSHWYAHPMAHQGHIYFNNFVHSFYNYAIINHACVCVCERHRVATLKFTQRTCLPSLRYLKRNPQFSPCVCWMWVCVCVLWRVRVYISPYMMYVCGGGGFVRAGLRRLAITGFDHALRTSKSRIWLRI